MEELYIFNMQEASQSQHTFFVLCTSDVNFPSLCLHLLMVHNVPEEQSALCLPLDLFNITLATPPGLKTR